MDQEAYFLPATANQCDLSGWSAILPLGAQILRTNLFGDVFLRDERGAIHLLDRGACTVAEIASSEDEFWRAISNDNQGWQLRPLADECRRAGMILGSEQCYAFTTLPVLGGDYHISNIWVSPWPEWFGLTADVFQQIKDLPDGAAVTLNFDARR